MATQDPTANYGWDLPTIDGSNNTWGEELNAVIGDTAEGIDYELNRVEVIASAALPKAGGTMTGAARFDENGLIEEDDKNISGTEIDWARGNFFQKTISGSTTFTFANLPSSRNNGTNQFIVIELTNAGTNVNWPIAVKWQDGVAPTFTASGKDIVVMYNRDGAGASVYAAHAISDPS